MADGALSVMICLALKMRKLCVDNLDYHLQVCHYSPCIYSAYMSYGHEWMREGLN